MKISTKASYSIIQNIGAGRGHAHNCDGINCMICTKWGQAHINNNKENYFKKTQQLRFNENNVQRQESKRSCVRGVDFDI